MVALYVAERAARFGIEQGETGEGMGEDRRVLDLFFQGFGVEAGTGFGNSTSGKEQEREKPG